MFTNTSREEGNNLNTKGFHHKSIHKLFQLVGLTFIMVFLLSGVLSAAAGAQSGDPLDGFSDYVQGVMEDWDVPGASVAIVHQGEVVFLDGFGMRDLENELPVTEDTLFGIGSSTKAFTAVLLLSQVEEGKLALDKPVQDYWPGFILEDGVAASMITARDLLSHRAGLPRYDATFMFHPMLNPQHVKQNLRHMAPVKDLRSGFLYSNYGYLLAGDLFEEVSGMSWEAGIRGKIFDPLGMTGSNLTLQELKAAPDFSRGYYLGEEQFEEVAYLDAGAMAPAGSINAGAADMAKWLKFNLGMMEEGAGKPISALGLQTMRTPVIPTAPRLGPHVSHQGYGLGWLVESYRGVYRVHHGGVAPGYSAMVSFLPEEGIGVAVLCNHSGSAMPQIVANEAMDRLLGLEPVAWNEEMLAMVEAQANYLSEYAVLDKDHRKTGTRPAHPLEAYVGSFGHPLYGTFQIALEDHALEATYFETSIPLEHWHFDVFVGKPDYFMSMQFAFRFLTDIHGNLIALEVDLDPFSTANPVTFARLPDVEKPEPEVLARLAGAYQVMGIPVTIQLIDEDQLIMSVPDQPDWVLEHFTGLRFKVKGLPGYEVEFKLDAQGEAGDTITLVQPHGTFSGQRVE